MENNVYELLDTFLASCQYGSNPKGYLLCPMCFSLHLISNVDLVHLLQTVYATLFDCPT